VRALADALRDVTSRHRGEVASGRRRAERVRSTFDWDRNAQATEAVYEAILGGRRATSVVDIGASREPASPLGDVLSPILARTPRDWADKPESSSRV
jgi:hypothetical protein